MNNPNGFSYQQQPPLEPALQDHVWSNRAEIKQCEQCRACDTRIPAMVMTPWQHGLSALSPNEALALDAAAGLNPIITSMRNNAV
ncbi:hypothetical protein L9G74_09870 [Shewanella sp. C32]|uniref:Uncharacterized protein n=1 Tax=Shewanella electrica TaxID=515560 RepID=A0ABT2FKE5_9GAMM|nr:hypothetical protein [Shewanella electrica]MCH1924805.1 hypothetical protein [Shewanella electrica]MCS4556748.1 hypothetical protein [Shewanella electrica]